MCWERYLDREEETRKASPAAKPTPESARPVSTPIVRPEDSSELASVTST